MNLMNRAKTMTLRWPLRVLSAVLLVVTCPVLAEPIDLDDITMTVVNEGVFDARQIDRPDTEAIRARMQEAGQTFDSLTLPSRLVSPERIESEMPTEPAARAHLPADAVMPDRPQPPSIRTQVSREDLRKLRDPRVERLAHPGPGN